MNTAAAEPQPDTEAIARTGLALIGAAARGDDLGLSVLLDDLQPDLLQPLVRFLASFAGAWLADEAKRTGGPERLSAVLSDLVLTSLREVR